jgi:release factor glutamine methyltransferase
MTPTVQQHLQQTGALLASVAGDLAPLEARMLAQHAWCKSREDLLREADQPVAEEAAEMLQKMAQRRLAREPMSQILGMKDFWKDQFVVTRDVLTPRADSETLIEALLAARADKNASLHMLDLGTGSGCLVLSALREYANASATAVDRSPAALAVAKGNAERLGLQARVRFLEGDWCNPLDSADRFDIVITNPPYIARAEIAALDEDVKGYEPHLALDGGIDGLDCYRTILSTIGAYLNPGAFVLAEVGQGQDQDVKKIGEANGLRHVQTHCDLGGIARIVVWTR